MLISMSSGSRYAIKITFCTRASIITKIIIHIFLPLLMLLLHIIVQFLFSVVLLFALHSHISVRRCIFCKILKATFFECNSSCAMYTIVNLNCTQSWHERLCMTMLLVIDNYIIAVIVNIIITIINNNIFMLQLIENSRKTWRMLNNTFLWLF